MTRIVNIDDKLINKTNDLGVKVGDLAKEMARHCAGNLDKMDVGSIHRSAYATKHIRELLSMIKSLKEKTRAYPLNGDFHFQAEADYYGKSASEHQRTCFW